jgi:uncharacterized membrane protein
VWKITIILGVFLTLLGFGGYFGTDAKSVTALIPAFVGVPFILLGLLARNDNLRKHVLHAAAMLGLIGFIGAAYRPIVKLTSGDAIENWTPITLQAIMAVSCLIFVGLCVKSFIDARRRRTAAGT